MSWWGGGSDKSSSSSSSSSSTPKDFSSSEEVALGAAGGGSNLMAGAGAGGGAVGGAGVREFQHMSMVLQQQLLVQQVINDLSDRAYEKCITSKPSDTLSGSQVACIKATVNKWLDTNEFITGRLAKKTQRQQGFN